MKSHQKKKNIIIIQSSQPQIKVQEPLFQQKTDLRLKKNSNKETYFEQYAQKEERYGFRENQIWQKSEISKLFQFYDAHGPQWKKMSEQITFRTANSLKNRFYTVLRNLMKLIFSKNPRECPRQRGQIPSKCLCRLYDGREEFEKYSGLLKEILRGISYDLQSKEIQQIGSLYNDIIVEIYHKIYSQRTYQNNKKDKQTFNQTHLLQQQKILNQFSNSQQKSVNNQNQIMPSNTANLYAGTGQCQYYLCFLNNTNLFWYLTPNSS